MNFCLGILSLALNIAISHGAMVSGWNPGGGNILNLTFTDEAGNTIMGQVKNPLYWEMGTEKYPKVIRWDDEAEFFIRTKDGKEYAISNTAVKERIIEIYGSVNNAGKLRGNTMELVDESDKQYNSKTSEEEWELVVLGASDEASAYIDNNSIKRSPEKTLRANYKMAWSNPIIRMSKFENKLMSNYIAHKEFDCNNGQMRCHAITIHFTDGTKETEEFSDPSWETPSPNSVAEAILEYICKEEKDIHSEDLFDAVFAEDFLKVDTLLKHKPELANIKDEDGLPLLHLAVKKQLQDIVLLLISNNTDIDMTQKDGWTALHLASSEGFTEIAKLLISHGANINAKTNAGATPLHIVAETGHIATARLLIEKGADIDVKQTEDYTPLLIAAQKGYIDLICFLLNNGANVNAKSDIGVTALHWAAIKGYKDIAELLIAKGADINATETSGITPLKAASLKGHKEIEDLIKHHGGAY